eukprot:c11151_g1_i1 orf=61-249(+)
MDLLLRINKHTQSSPHKKSENLLELARLLISIRSTVHLSRVTQLMHSSSPKFLVMHCITKYN